LKKPLASLLAALLLTPVLSYAGDTWQHVAKEQGLPSNELQFIKQDQLGTVWIGTLGGLVKFNAGKVEPTPVKGEAWDVTRVNESQYWVGTGNGAVLVSGAKADTSLAGTTVAPIVQFQPKTFLALSKDRRTEVSTLVEFNGENWTPVASLKGRRAVDMIRLNDGKVWVSIEGDGVAVFDPSKGTASPTRELGSQNVTTIMQDASGKVWCGLWQRGVMAYDGKTWTKHLADEGIYALSMRQDKAGNIWVATDKSGVWRYDGKAWVNDLKDEGPVSLLETTSDGKVWVSSQTTGGLRYWDGKTWTVSLEGPTPIRCLFETPSKQLMAGAVLDGLYLK